MIRDPGEPSPSTFERPQAEERQQDLPASRFTGQGLTPAQLAAAVAVVRHHADRMASRRQGFEGSRPEFRGER